MSATIYKFESSAASARSIKLLRELRDANCEISYRSTAPMNWFEDAEKVQATFVALSEFADATRKLHERGATEDFRRASTDITTMVFRTGVIINWLLRPFPPESQSSHCELAVTLGSVYPSLVRASHVLHPEAGSGQIQTDLVILGMYFDLMIPATAAGLTVTSHEPGSFGHKLQAACVSVAGALKLYPPAPNIVRNVRARVRRSLSQQSLSP